MRQAEVMENPKAEGFDKGVNRYRAQRTLGNEQGDIPRGLQHGLLLQGLQPPEAMG